MIAPFDDLIPYSGLWAGLQLGGFNRILPMRTYEEIAEYVRNIKRMWDHILGDLPASELDVTTVKKLELLCPQHALDNAELVRRLMDSRAIFHNCSDATMRRSILERLLTCARILSIHSWMEDTNYLQTCHAALSHLLPERPAKDTGFRDTFKNAFALDQKYFRASYIDLWLYSMRHFSELSELPCSNLRKDKGKPKPSRAQVVQDRFNGLARHAFDLEFRTRPVADILNAGAQFLPHEQPDPGSPDHSCDYINTDLKMRCNRPSQNSLRRDQKFLFLQFIYWPSAKSRKLYVTTFSILRDIAPCFWGQQPPSFVHKTVLSNRILDPTGMHEKDPPPIHHSTYTSGLPTESFATNRPTNTATTCVNPPDHREAQDQLTSSTDDRLAGNNSKEPSSWSRRRYFSPQAPNSSYRDRDSFHHQEISSDNRTLPSYNVPTAMELEPELPAEQDLEPATAGDVHREGSSFVADSPSSRYDRRSGFADPSEHADQLHSVPSTQLRHVSGGTSIVDGYVAAIDRHPDQLPADGAIDSQPAAPGAVEELRVAETSLHSPGIASDHSSHYDALAIIGDGAQRLREEAGRNQYTERSSFARNDADASSSSAKHTIFPGAKSLQVVDAASPLSAERNETSIHKEVSPALSSGNVQANNYNQDRANKLSHSQLPRGLVRRDTTWPRALPRPVSSVQHDTLQLASPSRQEPRSASGLNDSQAAEVSAEPLPIPFEAQQPQSLSGDGRPENGDTIDTISKTTSGQSEQQMEHDRQSSAQPPQSYNSGFAQGFGVNKSKLAEIITATSKIARDESLLGPSCVVVFSTFSVAKLRTILSKFASNNLDILRRLERRTIRGSCWKWNLDEEANFLADYEDLSHLIGRQPALLTVKHAEYRSAISPAEFWLGLTSHHFEYGILHIKSVNEEPPKNKRHKRRNLRDDAMSPENPSTSMNSTSAAHQLHQSHTEEPASLGQRWQARVAESEDEELGDPAVA